MQKMASTASFKMSLEKEGRAAKSISGMFRHNLKEANYHFNICEKYFNELFCANY